MKPGFFTSKAFAISLAIALVLLGGAAGTYYAMGGSSTVSRSTPCDAPSVQGQPLTATRAEAAEKGQRTVTYTIDASSYTGGRLRVCVDVGGIAVEPAPGGELELVFGIASKEQSAADATAVAAAFATHEGQLVVRAAQTAAGESGGFFDREGASVHLVVRVPQTGAYDIEALTDVGDIRVRDLVVGALSVTARIGDLIISGLDLEGDAAARADIGDVTLTLNSVQSGNVTARADVGNLEVQIPPRADTGYDAHAQTDVGEVVVRLDDAEAPESHRDGPGGSERARTSGFAEKPTRVTITARTEVGDVRILMS